MSESKDKLGTPLLFTPRRTELSDKEYAAVHLRVPMSGTPWLDEMIEASRRDEFAKDVFSALAQGHQIRNINGVFCFSKENLAITIPNFIENVTEVTDALLAASNKRKEGE